MATVYNPKAVIDGLVLNLDAANKKSYSQNYHPNPTDIFSWYSSNSGSSNNATPSRDTIPSPVGNTPLKMVTTGNDSHIGTYNATKWNLGSAVSGQTWTVSVWARASAATTGQIFIFEANSSGTFVAAPALTINITTEWQRFSYSYTFVNATTTNIQTRLDGADVFGSSVTIWWDGLQVERSSSVTDFTSSYTGDNILDISGKSNNGTLVNGPSYNGSNRGSLVFDGVNDYVDCGNTTSLSAIGGTTNITVSGWVYYTAYGGGGQTYSVITVKGNPWTWLLENPSNTFRFRITAGGADVNIADTSTHLLNTWYNVVGTYDGSNMAIYVNGVLKNTRAQTGTLATNAVTAKIGTFQGTDYNLTGRIANISVYNRTLTAAEIQRNFNALRSRFGI